MKNKKPTITFYAAECMEFLEQWDLYDNLTLKEAVEAYRKILKKNSCCGPGIGFVLHDRQFPDYSEIHWQLYQGGICREDIDLIKAYREHPLVKQAIRDMETYVPMLEKDKAEEKRKWESRKKTGRKQRENHPMER